MAQVSVGQVENLEDLLRGLASVSELLESSCREQVSVAERLCSETREEVQNSQSMLVSANQQEQAAQQRVEAAQESLDSATNELSEATSALSYCLARPCDEHGNPPDCSSEESSVEVAAAAVEQAQVELHSAQSELAEATAIRQAMEQRVDIARQASSIAEQVLERTVVECSTRLASVSRYVDEANARLSSAQRALNAYLSANPSAREFYDWLKWNPSQKDGAITPDKLNERMSLSQEQQRMFQQYLYERNSSYRSMVDKFRGEWARAKGDVERNMVARNARIQLSGAFAENIVQYALAPMGKQVNTQGRTYVGDSGRYTKTDLIIEDLHVPVVLGRGDGMGAPVSGSMAFEVKCGKPEYLYSQKEHMAFQAEGHKQADAQCTICSRDIHDLSPDNEKELRETLREAGSPMIGMLPYKSEIDQSCLEFIREGEK